MNQMQIVHAQSACAYAQADLSMVHFAYPR